MMSSKPPALLTSCRKSTHFWLIRKLFHTGYLSSVRIFCPNHDTHYETIYEPIRSDCSSCAMFLPMMTVSIGSGVSWVKINGIIQPSTSSLPAFSSLKHSIIRLKIITTRIHSSRIRTVRNSSRLGEGVCSWGVPGLGGVCSWGVSQHALRQTPPGTEWQTRVKT